MILNRDKSVNILALKPHDKLNDNVFTMTVIYHRAFLKQSNLFEALTTFSFLHIQGYVVSVVSNEKFGRSHIIHTRALFIMGNFKALQDLPKIRLYISR